MTQIISEKVKVGFNDFPRWVSWKKRIYQIKKVGLHYTFGEGKVLYHIFTVTTEGTFMKLRFDTENLSWRLEEVSDE